MPRPLEFSQVSADAFKYWSRCQRQFYYRHVRKLQWPADIQHFSLGKDVHKLADYQSRGLDCEPLLATASPEVRLSWRKLAAHPIMRLPVLANEWAFHVPMTLDDGYTEWLTGRIDRVARDGDRVLVIDWKTGTGVPRNPEADWQTRLYLYALIEVAKSPSAANLGLNAAGPLQPEQVCFVYVEVKADPQTPVREVTLPYDTARHEATRDLLRTILSRMAVEEAYPLPDNGLCPDRYCGYRTICGIGEVV